jgi:hypothetical protein
VRLTGSSTDGRNTSTLLPKGDDGDESLVGKREEPFLFSPYILGEVGSHFNLCGRNIQSGGKK